MDGSRRKRLDRRPEQERAGLNILRRDRVCQINQRRRWGHRKDRALHLADVRVGERKIGQQRDNRHISYNVDWLS